VFFVFPSEEFDPSEINLEDPLNYALISKHLYRVQKFTTKYYVFRHHLETNVSDNNQLLGITWKRITMLNRLKKVYKVRLNHLGQIVRVGEY
jgi:CRISPR-associated endonuclease Csn1